jgi:hypothetical protein
MKVQVCAMKVQHCASFVQVCATKMQCFAKLFGAFFSGEMAERLVCIALCGVVAC